VPEIVVAKRWQRILHNRIGARLRASLIAHRSSPTRESSSPRCHSTRPGERVTRAAQSRWLHLIDPVRSWAHAATGQHDLPAFAVPSARAIRKSWAKTAALPSWQQPPARSLAPDAATSSSLRPRPSRGRRCRIWCNPGVSTHLVGPPTTAGSERQQERRGRGPPRPPGLLESSTAGVPPEAELAAASGESGCDGHRFCPLAQSATGFPAPSWLPLFRVKPFAGVQLVAHRASAAAAQLAAA
jgi:hypothetical protein